MAEEIIALLVAAGKSERMQTDVPKPYMQLGDENLMRRTVKAFLNHPEINGVRVVIRREHHTLYKQAINGLTIFPCAIGGDSRQDSVRLGLESIAHRKPKYVLVHDIARPLASPALISRVIKSLEIHKAAIPCLPVTDTIKRKGIDSKIDTIDRHNLYTAQTPQGFHFADLLAAHQKLAGQSHTDDAALMEQIGQTIALIEGDADNIKITTQSDFKRMQTFLTLNTETRTGMGYDVHQLKAHDMDTPLSQQNIRLCGINIPFTHHLVGHSDADVGMHALVDAILGAIGSGDIGTHFSPDDRRWQGADSSRFLLHAYELLSSRGGELVNLDVTLICERPKVAPYRAQMVSYISQLLKIAPDRVSIKATTTEKLGFAGRGEGIAAQAVATVRLPR